MKGEPMTATTPSLERMTVGDVMHRGIVTCSPTTPLTTVAREMAAHRIHCVVVRTDGADAPWGVVSDLDFVAAAALGAGGGNAGAAAATPVVTVRAEDGLRRAMQLMAEHQVTHLVVVDHHGRPRGVISTLDVAEALAD
jgi:CBS domain-containing protein